MQGAVAALDAALELIDTGRVHSLVHAAGQGFGHEHGQGLDTALDKRGGQARASASSSASLSDSLGVSEKERSEEREEDAEDAAAREGGQPLDSSAGHGSAQLHQLDTGHVANARFAACWDRSGGLSTGGAMRARIGECVPTIKRLAAERGKDPIGFFTEVCERFKADRNVKAKRLGLRVLLSQLEQWADQAPASGPAAVATDADFEAMERRLALKQPAYQQLKPVNVEGSPAPAETREFLASRKGSTS